MDNKEKIITWLGLIALLALAYWGYSTLVKGLTATSERGKQEWVDYKTRCEELGGLASKQLVGYRCDK